MKRKKKKYIRPTITLVSDEFDITMNNLPVCSPAAGDDDLMGKQTSFDDWDDEDDEWLPVAGKVSKRVWEDE